MNFAVFCLCFDERCVQYCSHDEWVCWLYRVEILPKGVLLFKSVRVVDAAVYTCRATNSFGSTSRNITLVVRGESILADSWSHYNQSLSISFHLTVFLTLICQHIYDTSNDTRPHRVHCVDAAICYRCRMFVTSVCLSVCWTHGWAMQKRPNRSRCRLGRWLAFMMDPENHALCRMGSRFHGKWHFRWIARPTEKHWQSLLRCIQQKG